MSKLDHYYWSDLGGNVKVHLQRGIAIEVFIFPECVKPDLVAVATEAALRAVDEDEAWTYYSAATAGTAEYSQLTGEFLHWSSTK